MQEYKSQPPWHKETQKEGIYFVLQRAPKGQTGAVSSPEITFLSGFFFDPILLVLLLTALPWEHFRNKPVVHSLSPQNLLLGSLA